MILHFLFLVLLAAAAGWLVCLGLLARHHEE
jgi:hypothetical protein